MIRTVLATALLACSTTALAEVPTWESDVARTRSPHDESLSARSMTVDNDGDIHVDVRFLQAPADLDRSFAHVAHAIIGANTGYFRDDALFPSRFLNEDSCGLQIRGAKVLNCINDAPTSSTQNPWPLAQGMLVLQEKASFQAPGQPPFIEERWNARLPEGHKILAAGFGDNDHLAAITTDTRGPATAWPTRFVVSVTPGGGVHPSISPLRVCEAGYGDTIVKEETRVADHGLAVDVALCKRRDDAFRQPFIQFNAIDAVMHTPPVAHDITLPPDASDVLLDIANDGTAYVFYRKQQQAWFVSWHARTGTSPAQPLGVEGAVESVSILADTLGIVLKDDVGNRTLAWLDRTQPWPDPARRAFLPADRYPDAGHVVFNAQGDAFFLSRLFPSQNAPHALNVVRRSTQPFQMPQARTVDLLHDSQWTNADSPPLLAPIGDHGVAVALTVHPNGDPQSSLVRVSRYDLQD